MNKAHKRDIDKAINTDNHVLTKITVYNPETNSTNSYSAIHGYNDGTYETILELKDGSIIAIPEHNILCKVYSPDATEEDDTDTKSK